MSERPVDNARDIGIRRHFPEKHIGNSIRVANEKRTGIFRSFFD